MTTPGVGGGKCLPEKAYCYRLNSTEEKKGGRVRPEPSAIGRRTNGSKRSAQRRVKIRGGGRTDDKDDA